MQISCVIPTRNRAAWLPAAIKSVLSQEIPAGSGGGLRAAADPGAGAPNGIEIVVADDGSTDGSRELLAARFPPARFPQISWHRVSEQPANPGTHYAGTHHEGSGHGIPQLAASGTAARAPAREPARSPQNAVSRDRLLGRGPGAARNAGVAAASGEIIMFLDSDDLWLPGHAARLLAVLARGYGVAYGTTRNIDLVGGGEFLIPAAGQGREGDCFTALLQWCFLVPSALALRREVFLASGGFGSLPLGEDWAFLLQLAQTRPFGWAGPEPVSQRHLHPGSLCLLPENQNLAACLQALHDLPWLASCRQPAQARFGRLLAWLAARPRPFSTVQAWYQALLADGMVDLS